MAYAPLLPIELWQDIAGYVKKVDQSSLMQVNRSFAAMIQPVLWSHILILGQEYNLDKGEVQVSSSDLPKFSLARDHTQGLLRKLEASASHRSWVRHCTIAHFKCVSMQASLRLGEPSPALLAFKQLLADIFHLIGSLPLLKGVELLGSDIPSESFYHLCSRTHLELGIVVDRVIFFATDAAVEVEPDAHFNVVRFRSQTSQLRQVMKSLTTLSLGSNLVSMALGTEHEPHLGHFFQSHIDYDGGGGVSLPKLEFLSISWMRQDYLGFFQSTPNLLELQISGMIKLQLGTGPLPAHMIPKLRRFHGHNSYLPFFARGRPLKSCTVRSSNGPGHPVFLGQDDNISLVDLGPRFGSTVEVEKVEWDACSQNRELLDYLVAQNPKIRHLDFVPAVAYTPEILGERLETVKGLKELRTLRIRSLNHVPVERMLAKERAFCEMMRREGSPFLEWVAFSHTIDWRWSTEDKDWVPEGQGMEVYEMSKRRNILGPVQETSS